MRLVYNFENNNIIFKVSTFIVRSMKDSVYFYIIIGSIISSIAFLYFYQNGLGVAYNDARSHLDIARRVVESLSPGLAQLGSVWLPLPHVLMIPFVWSDFLWHTGLAGSVISMGSYIISIVLIYQFLKEIEVGYIGRAVGVAIFGLNLNVLYLQSTAMTELLLLATMTAACYELMKWVKTNSLAHLIYSALFIMLSTLVRYDGWFLLVVVFVFVLVYSIVKRGVKSAEGLLVLFTTLSAVGIFLWILWNLLIFKDPLYFAFGPFSAKSQQDILLSAGGLPTKYDLFLSIKVYVYALLYNSGVIQLLLAFVGFIVFIFSKFKSIWLRLTSITLLAPLAFNILALFLGHSVLYVADISGNTWFNVRYGIMLMPAVAIFIGYLVHRSGYLKSTIIGILAILTLFSYTSFDSVTIDDARVGSSQKNVSEVAGWLNTNALHENEFILISAASHDAIIFSSGLPMKRFIHEGTGDYWRNAHESPEKWVRWIIMRTNDQNDLTYTTLSKYGGFEKYDLVDHYPFADIYEIKEEYRSQIENHIL